MDRVAGFVFVVMMICFMFLGKSCLEEDTKRDIERFKVEKEITISREKVCIESVYIDAYRNLKKVECPLGTINFNKEINVVICSCKTPTPVPTTSSSQ